MCVEYRNKYGFVNHEFHEIRSPKEIGSREMSPEKVFFSTLSLALLMYSRYAVYSAVEE